jgi:hypothetical protein
MEVINCEIYKRNILYKLFTFHCTNYSRSTPDDFHFRALLRPANLLSLHACSPQTRENEAKREKRERLREFSPQVVCPVVTSTTGGLPV